MTQHEEDVKAVRNDYCRDPRSQMEDRINRILDRLEKYERALDEIMNGPNNYCHNIAREALADK